MHQVVKGLVIKSVDYKEADKILTVITETMGKITVGARGARRKGSRLTSSCQLFAYSGMTLFEKGGRYSLNEADPIEQFTGLTRRLDKLALASYFAEVLNTEAEEDQGDPRLLRLALNCLYALSEDLAPQDKIKAVFELRYMALSGYAPALEDCAACGDAPGLTALLDIDSGLLYCAACAPRGHTVPLDGAALSAMRYIMTCDLKKLFSFQLPQSSQDLLSEVGEAYLLARLERRFRALDFYRSVGDMI